jgi:hypothetical protein
MEKLAELVRAKLGNQDTTRELTQRDRSLKAAPPELASLQENSTITPGNRFLQLPAPDLNSCTSDGGEQCKVSPSGHSGFRAGLCPIT